VIYALLALLIFALSGSRAERQEWNRGYCRRHGMPWIYTWTDSQGGNGYICRALDACSTCQSWGHDRLENNIGSCRKSTITVTSCTRIQDRTVAYVPTEGLYHYYRYRNGTTLTIVASCRWRWPLEMMRWWEAA
jgi:hypothetical protein